MLSLALHVLDEALSGFLPMYNAFVTGLRASYPWLPLPVFSFSAWLTGLIIAVVLLFALSPLVFAGSRAMRPVAWFFGLLMLANAVGHFGMSIYMRALAPGVYSSPIVLMAALAMLITTYKSRQSAHS